MNLKETFVPLDRAVFLIRNGLGADPARMSYYTQALQNPQSTVTMAAFRPFVAELLENLSQWVFTDQTAYARLVQFLLSRRMNEMEVNPDKRLEGTASATKNFRDDTPGQNSKTVVVIKNVARNKKHVL